MPFSPLSPLKGIHRLFWWGACLLPSAQKERISQLFKNMVANDYAL